MIYVKKKDLLSQKKELLVGLFLDCCPNLKNSIVFPLFSFIIGNKMLTTPKHRHLNIPSNSIDCFQPHCSHFDTYENIYENFNHFGMWSPINILFWLLPIFFDHSPSMGMSYSIDLTEEYFHFCIYLKVKSFKSFIEIRVCFSHFLLKYLLIYLIYYQLISTELCQGSFGVRSRRGITNFNYYYQSSFIATQNQYLRYNIVSAFRLSYLTNQFLIFYCL